MMKEDIGGSKEEDGRKNGIKNGWIKGIMVLTDGANIINRGIAER